MKYIFVILAVVWCTPALASEVIPPAPKAYFNDYAGVVSAATAAKLNQQLEAFERDTSNQIVVVVFPKMQSDSSIEDYTVRVAESWKVGQKKKDNGAVLFVFTQDRKMFLQVGYGLEGALPDALAKQIIENEINPRFKSGDYDGGLTAGVAAILAATRGEYKGAGQTAAKNPSASPTSGVTGLIVGAFVVLWIIITVVRLRRGVVYSGSGWSVVPWLLLNAFLSSGSSGRSGGGWGGGGSSSGGGFSGGGGSFGGGGAGGSW